MPPRLCWVSQRAPKTYTALSAWVTVGAGAVSMTRKQGREEGESCMGGCSFHWAAPCAQVSVWSHRWWISLFWLVDEPWPGVIRFPFVYPPPILSAVPSPSELLLCEDFLDGGGIPMSLWCSGARQRGMMLMELHSLKKSSPGMFWKTKPPHWDVFQSFLWPCWFQRWVLTRRWHIGSCMWRANALKFHAFH